MESVNPIDINNTDLFLNKEEQLVKNLGIMAAKVAFYNFQWRYITLVIYLSAQYSHAVDTFISRYNQSVAIKSRKFRPLHRVHIPQYVLFGEDTSDITEYLRWLVEVKYDNTGKYLLMCYSTDVQKCDEDHVFKTLAEINIVNGIFLRISDSNDEPVPFTYHMILPGKCKNNEPVKLDIRSDCLKDSCFKNIYGENLKNMHKCPLIVSTYEQPPFMYLFNGTREPAGGDADMLKVVTSALNTTLIIKTPADGDDWGHYVDNNWTGSMGDVFNDRAHLSVCSLPLTTHKYANFQISFIYNTMDIVWVAALPTLNPSWEKLIHPFNYYLRVAICVSFTLITFFSGFLRTHTWRNLAKSLKIGYPRQSILFYSWILFLGVPVLRMPSRRSFLILVSSWIWFSFVIRSCYQAALISSLKERVYESYFESFEEVFQNKRAYGGQSSYREYFADEKSIYNTWQHLKFSEAYDELHKISNGTSRFVLAFNKEMVIEHLLEHSGTRRLQIIPLKILNSPTVMYLKKYSPLAVPLNTILSRAVESGYASAWHMRFARQKKHLFEHSQDYGPLPLTLEHFGGCIVIIIIGWAVCLLFFAVEVYCGKIEK